MFERFTDTARAIVTGAQQVAGELGHGYVGTEHLLLSILVTGQGVAYDVLRAEGLEAQAVRATIANTVGSSNLDADALESIGIDLEAVRAKVEETFGPGALDGGPARMGHKPFTPRAKKVMELSLREAIALKHKYIGSEHLLLGMLREGEGLAAKILADAGLDFTDLRAKTIAAIPKV